jgi:hypothetical protein
MQVCRYAGLVFGFVDYFIDELGFNSVAVVIFKADYLFIEDTVSA